VGYSKFLTQVSWRNRPSISIWTPKIAKRLTFVNVAEFKVFPDDFIVKGTELVFTREECKLENAFTII